MLPVARLSDFHVCPMVNVLVPHVGGPILPICAIRVLSGGLPTARIGDLALCVGPPDVIVTGVPKVLVMGKPVARITDKTMHGGMITVGLPNVLIGGGTTAQVQAPTVGNALFQQLKEWAIRKLTKELDPPKKTKSEKRVIEEVKEESKKFTSISPDAKSALADAFSKGASAKVEIDNISEQISALVGGTVAKAPLKNEHRVLEKATNYAEERGSTVVERQDIERIKDIARNTIVVPGGREDEALLRLRQACPQIADKNVKIVSSDVDPCGYSGINVTLKSLHGMPCEIQINSPEMIYAKEKPDDARRILGAELYEEISTKPGMPEGGKGHALYEEYRVLAPDDPKKVEVAAKSRAYYDAVRNAGKVTKK